MRRTFINIHSAVNKFEQQTKVPILNASRILKSTFFNTVREIIRIAGAHQLNLFEDDIIEVNTGIFTLCVEWTDITITNNLTNQTCDIMTYTKIGNVLCIPANCRGFIL